MDIDKSIGMFLGLAIGDALGAPLEFKEAEFHYRIVQSRLEGQEYRTTCKLWMTTYPFRQLDSLNYL